MESLPTLSISLFMISVIGLEVIIGVILYLVWSSLRTKREAYHDQLASTFNELDNFAHEIKQATGQALAEITNWQKQTMTETSQELKAKFSQQTEKNASHLEKEVAALLAAFSTQLDQTQQELATTLKERHEQNLDEMIKEKEAQLEQTVREILEKDGQRYFAQHITDNQQHQIAKNIIGDAIEQGVLSQ